MKLKQAADDFHVEELGNELLNMAGQFSLYRLEKSGWTTPDAVNVIKQRWNIAGSRLSWGGLKDRHAVTVQYLTIERGPARNLSHQRLNLTYLGRRSRAFTSEDISANRFSIVLRSLPKTAVSSADATIAEVRTIGLPNYFDDQRFGSVCPTREFVGKELVLGHFERALWLALTDPFEFDRAEAKREKLVLRELWGDWSACVSRLKRGHARSLMAYLAANPSDFRGAIARLHPELQGLHLAAYQSDLWNRMLSRWLTVTLERDSLALVELKLGRVPVPVRMPPEMRAEWESLALPLPSARIKSDPSAVWSRIVDDVLKDEGLTLADLKVKGLRKPFFSKGERAGCVHPVHLESTSAPDDRNPGLQKLTLKFDLPRGSYATMLVKRITATVTSRSPTL